MNASALYIEESLGKVISTTREDGDEHRRSETMSEEGYNGYTNFETWSMGLWWDNDEGLYEMAREAIKDNFWDKDDAFKLGEWLENFTDEMFIENPSGSMAEEFRGKGTNHVDWQELAETMFEE